MKIYKFTQLTSSLLFVVSTALVHTQALAANECKVMYQYNYDASNGIKRRTAYVTLSLGQTKSVNRSRIDFVKNIQPTKVKLYNKNLLTNRRYTYDLAKGAQDPITGVHLVNVKLEKIKCIRPSTDSAIDVIAKQMKSAGKTAEQVALHLKNQLNQSMGQGAKWLKIAGYNGAQVTQALKGAFSANATQAAQTIKQVFNASPNQISSWLKQAGYSVKHVAKALKEGLKLKLLDIASVLKQVFRTSTQSLASALKYAGYTLIQVATALEDTDATAEDAAKTLKAIFNASHKNIASALKAAGYKAKEIAQALHKNFKLSAQQIKPILISIGYSASQAAEAVKSILGEIKDQQVTVETINEANMPNAKVTIVINKGSHKGYLRIMGEGLGEITGVSGLPIRSSKIRNKKSDIMRVIKNFPLGNSSSGTYLLMDLEFLHRAGNWTGATRGNGNLLVKKGRRLNNGHFTWKIVEASQAVCPKGQRQVKGVCR